MRLRPAVLISAAATFVQLGTAATLFAQTSGFDSLFQVDPLFAAHPAAPRTVAVAAPPPFLSTLGQQPAGPPPTPRHTGIKAMAKGLVSDVAHLPSKENLMWVGIGSGLALAAHQADVSVNHHLVGNHTADTFFKPADRRLLAQLATGVQSRTRSIEEEIVQHATVTRKNVAGIEVASLLVF